MPRARAVSVLGMSPRRYDLTKRRAGSEATRQRILEAARAILGGKGDLSDFSVEAVAERANVARMTVYNQFRSRANLLDSLADHLAGRGGMERMREVFASRSVEEGLRQLVGVFTGFWASDPVTMRRLRAMGVVFPADAHGPRARDAWRREAVVHLLARHGIRAVGARRSSVSELIDTTSVLTSFEVFDQLVAEGRKLAEVEALLTGLVLASLKRARGSPGDRRHP